MFNNNAMPFTMPVAPAGYGGNGGGMGSWGNDWIALAILALIFGDNWGFGGGGMGMFLPFLFMNGFGGFGNGSSGNGISAAAQGALTREQACIDNNFQNLMREASNTHDAVNVGFANLNSTICNQQYDTARMLNEMNISNLQSANAANVVALQNANALQTQLAECCCNTREAIQANTTQGVMNTNAIQNQIQQCCCANEKDIMQLNYNIATQNCATLQAIDKVGDRIIDYMSAQELQKVRDENQTLRFEKSQANQNSYLVNTLRPFPVAAYQVCNPFTGSYGYNYNNGYGNGYGCGCNSNCGCA